MSFKKPFRAAPVRLGPYYQAQRRGQSRILAAKVIGAAVIAGLAGGALFALSGRGASTASNGLPRRNSVAASVYYPGCNAARAAGAAPLFRGQPGYRPEMDGDGDGIACEPHRAGR